MAQVYYGLPYGTTERRKEDRTPPYIAPVVETLDYGSPPKRVTRFFRPGLNSMAGIRQWASQQSWYQLHLRPPYIPQTPNRANAASVSLHGLGMADQIAIPAVYVGGPH